MTHKDPAQGSDRAFGATALCTTLLAALLQAPLAAQTAVLRRLPRRRPGRPQIRQERGNPRRAPPMNWRSAPPTRRRRR
jgi:hypothetical protein